MLFVLLRGRSQIQELKLLSVIDIYFWYMSARLCYTVQVMKQYYVCCEGKVKFVPMVDWAPRHEDIKGVEV
jgi:hypothetical protein